jgi:hypothetical protein
MNQESRNKKRKKIRPHFIIVVIFSVTLFSFSFIQALSKSLVSPITDWMEWIGQDQASRSPGADRFRLEDRREKRKKFHSDEPKSVVCLSLTHVCQFFLLWSQTHKNLMKLESSSSRKEEKSLKRSGLRVNLITRLRGKGDDDVKWYFIHSSLTTKDLLLMHQVVLSDPDRKQLDDRFTFTLTNLIAETKTRFH